MNFVPRSSRKSVLDRCLECSNTGGVQPMLSLTHQSDALYCQSRPTCSLVALSEVLIAPCFGGSGTLLGPHHCKRSPYTRSSPAMDLVFQHRPNAACRREQGCRRWYDTIFSYGSAVRGFSMISEADFPAGIGVAISETSNILGAKHP